jgi:hypothetical protein
MLLLLAETVAHYAPVYVKAASGIDHSGEMVTL